MFRPCAILVASVCLVACSRHQALVVPQETACSSSLSVQQLLDNTNQHLQEIRVLYTENQLASTEYGKAILRDFNQVYSMIYERRFERLVEACHLAEAITDSLQQHLAKR